MDTQYAFFYTLYPFQDCLISAWTDFITCLIKETSAFVFFVIVFQFICLSMFQYSAWPNIQRKKILIQRKLLRNRYTYKTESSRCFFPCSWFLRKQQRALVFLSKQAMESIHADFKRTWEKYLEQKKHSEHSSRFLRALLTRA